MNRITDRKLYYGTPILEEPKYILFDVVSMGNIWSKAVTLLKSRLKVSHTHKIMVIVIYGLGKLP